MLAQKDFQEHCIMNFDSKSMVLFKLENNKYDSVGIYNINDGATQVTSVFFPELTVNLINIFKD